MAANDTVTVAIDGVLAWVALNRPHARNAVNLDLCHALKAAFERVDADPAVKAVLLIGEGPVFCAGADLKERKGRDAAWVRARRLASFAAYDAIATCSKPVVALVHGAVVGSGGEIAMAADFIVAGEGTVFRFPEAHWGTVGATQRLQRVIGVGLAKELLFTGRDMPAEEAHRRGLVARLVPDAELAAAGRALGGRIAGAPAEAMALTKKAVDLGARTDLAGGIRIEMAMIEQMLATTDWQQTIAAFDEKIGGRKGGHGAGGHKGD